MCCPSKDEVNKDKNYIQKKMDHLLYHNVIEVQKYNETPNQI